MLIRPEQPKDHISIRQITEAAFAPKAYSDGTEGKLIEELRLSGKLTLSLVAVSNDNIVGHVAFSPVTIGSTKDGWFGLGPVAVQTELQRQGIGSNLINEGLQRLKQNNARGCALIGDPNYYQRFGFLADGSIQYKDLPQKNVQWLSFDESTPTGELKFADAFEN